MEYQAKQNVIPAALKCFQGTAERREGTMGKKRIAAFVACFIFGTVLFGTAGAAEPLVNNGDFEETHAVPEKDSIYKRMEAINFKAESPLVLPEGWTLNLTNSARDGEYRLITDSARAQSGSKCIYLKGHLMTTANFDVNAGDEMEISLYVKNPEKSDIAFYFYCYTKNEEGRLGNIGSLSFREATETEWTKHTKTIKIPEEIKGKKLKVVKAAITSRAGTYVDNITISRKKAE